MMSSEEVKDQNEITKNLLKWSRKNKKIYSANWKSFNSKMKAIASGENYKDIKIDKKSAVLQATFFPLAPAILTFHAINVHKDEIKNRANDALKKIQDFPGEMSERVKKGIFKGLKYNEKEKILINEIERMGKSIKEFTGTTSTNIGNAITGDIKDLEALYYTYKYNSFAKLSADAMKKKLTRIRRKEGLNHSSAKILPDTKDKLMKIYEKHLNREGEKNFKYETIRADRVVKGIVQVFNRKIQKMLPSKKEVNKKLKKAGILALKGAVVTGAATASVVMAPFAIAAGVATTAAVTAAFVATTPIRLALVGALGLGAAGYFAGKKAVKAFKQDSLLMNHLNGILGLASGVGTEVRKLATKAFKAAKAAAITVGSTLLKGAKAVKNVAVKGVKLFIKGAKALALRTKQAAFDMKEIGKSLIEISKKNVENMIATGKIVKKAYENTYKQQGNDIPILPVIRAIGSKIADDFKVGITKIKNSFKSIQKTGLLNAIRSFKLQKKLDERLVNLQTNLDEKKHFVKLMEKSDIITNVNKNFHAYKNKNSEQKLMKKIDEQLDMGQDRKKRRPKKK